MKTREIARQEWQSFFDEFSRQNHGRLAIIENLSQDFGAQREGGDLLLDGVVADVGQESGSVAIILGMDPEEHVTHAVDHVRQVDLEEDDDGIPQALQIQSEDGERTILRLRSSVLG